MQQNEKPMHAQSLPCCPAEGDLRENHALYHAGKRRELFRGPSCLAMGPDLSMEQKNSNHVLAESLPFCLAEGNLPENHPL